MSRKMPQSQTNPQHPETPENSKNTDNAKQPDPPFSFSARYLPN